MRTWSHDSIGCKVIFMCVNSVIKFKIYAYLVRVVDLGTALDYVNVDGSVVATMLLGWR